MFHILNCQLMTDGGMDRQTTEWSDKWMEILTFMLHLASSRCDNKDHSSFIVSHHMAISEDKDTLFHSNGLSH